VTHAHFCDCLDCMGGEPLEPLRVYPVPVSRRRGKRGPYATCLRGHAMTKENSVTTRSGDRYCRACKQQNDRNWLARRRAARGLAA
jgi:hypothetical protein